MADLFEQGLRWFGEQRLLMEHLLLAGHITRTEVDAICVSGHGLAPTGAAKTRVAVEALLAFLTKLAREAGGVSNAIAVWVAHSRELCEQACCSIEDVWLSAEEAPPMHLARLWGRNAVEIKAALAQAVLPAQGGVIVVTSPTTL